MKDVYWGWLAIPVAIALGYLSEAALGGPGFSGLTELLVFHAFCILSVFVSFLAMVVHFVRQRRALGLQALLVTVLMATPYIYAKFEAAFRQARPDKVCQLRSLAIQDGRVAWETNLSDKTPHEVYCSSPEQVILSNGGNSTAYSGKDGASKWNQPFAIKKRTLGEGKVIDETGLYAMVRPQGRDRMLLAAMSAQTGEIRWQLDSKYGDNVLGISGKVLIVDSDGGLTAHSASDGQILWMQRANYADRCSVGEKWIALQSTKAGEFCVVDPRDGRIDTVIGFDKVRPMHLKVRGSQIVGAADDRIFAYNADSKKLDWCVKAGMKVYGLQADQATVYAISMGPGPKCRAFSLATGNDLGEISNVIELLASEQNFTAVRQLSGQISLLKAGKVMAKASASDRSEVAISGERIFTLNYNW